MKRILSLSVTLVTAVASLWGQAAGYEYWLDNEYNEKKSGTISGGSSFALDIDISEIDKSYPHSLNMRIADATGKWGAISRKMIYLLDDDVAKPIGYRHFIDGALIGYGELSASDVEGLTYIFSLPEGVGIDPGKGTFKFDGLAVSMQYKGNFNYCLQLKSAIGWNMPVRREIPVEDEYSYTAIEAQVPSVQTFSGFSAYRFVAVKFSVPDGPVYFHTDQPAKLDLYKDGLKKASLSPGNLAENRMLELESGEYYGVLYKASVNDYNPDSVIKLRLMNKDINAVVSPEFSYNGRYINLSVSEPDADIYYMMTDSGYDEMSNPVVGWNDENALLYDGTPLDVKGLNNVLAIARKEGKSDSPVSVFRVKCYGDENRALVSEPGNLGKCYEWNGGRMDGKRFSVAGPLDASDYEWLNTHTSSEHLDLSEVTGDSIPDGALAPEWVKSIVLPSDVKRMSGKIFKTSGAPFNTNVTLCALKWTSSNPIPAGMLDSLGNRNMLLYVADASLAADVSDHEHNLVAGSVAESLQLYGGHFYCPEEFVAKEASYYRYNNWETGIDGECAGWKTIVVPYDVQRVEHSKGDLTPFGVNPEMELLRYWLYEPTTSGWERATAIRANEPYLIAMPNNGVYYEPFNVGGNVWFKATNAVVAVTPDEISRDFAGGRKLVGVYEGMASAEDRFGINQDTVVVGGVTYRPGSVFISQVDKGISPASPFEAYMLSGGESMIRPMEIFTSSEVEAVLADMEMKVWTENGGIRIQAGFTARVDVFDMTGRRVAVADVKAGEVCRVDGLAPGIYIAANRKVRLK